MLKLNWIKVFNNNFDAPLANCWALTMLIWGALDMPKWAAPEEIEEWLFLNTHEAIGKPRPGDVLVMRSPFNYGRPNCIEHTAVYMGNGDFWHKPGIDVGQWTTLADMKKIYKNATILYYVRVNNMQDANVAKNIDEQISSLLRDAA
jgi:hypothetical protein